MNISSLKRQIPDSPAFLFDQTRLTANLAQLSQLRDDSGCKALYSIKSLPLTAILDLAKPFVDGFSVSSLFEARLAHEVLAGQGSVHLTTPGLRPDEIDALGDVCTHISFNSLTQHRLYANRLKQRVSLGLRVNPKLSFIADDRYNPCRVASKLGIDIDALSATDLSAQVQGLHLHSLHAMTDYAPLPQILAKLTQHFGDKLSRLAWINLGGGFLHNEINDQQLFIDTVSALIARYQTNVYIEPGKAVVGNTGLLLATVIDCFVSDGKMIAVLDSSVNHLPEVFEYQTRPDLYEHQPGGGYKILLAGSTCLAGDVFGDYEFAQPLQIGDRLVFTNVGAYSLVKAHRFNGYNLPAVYLCSDTRFTKIKSYSYQQYRELWSEDKPVQLR